MLERIFFERSKKMKLIVDEINKQTCPFYASKDWENDLKIEYEKGGCILDT